MKDKTALSDPVLPGGTVTFLFTDIEGSTALLNQLRDQYATLLTEHHRIIRGAIDRWHGREVDTQGDAFFAAFPKATEAVAAVADIQKAIFNQTWPEDAHVRVRMGLHTGEPWLVEEGYVGMDVHRAARIGHVGHGGQVLLSETTTALVRDELLDGLALLDLGRHRLKDMRRPERIHQLVIEGLQSEFPPLKSLEVILPTPIITKGDSDRGTREVGPSPYRGLAAFHEGDAELFFGREAFTRQLAEAVKERGLVAVVIGPSGSGKSSTVFAGLLPQLREDDRWLIIETRPGSKPFYSLAGALLPTLEDGLGETESLKETKRLAQSIQAGEISLFQVISRALERNYKSERMLLVIDQFEELFTHRTDPDAQRLFLDELLAAAETGATYLHSPLVILLTLRADFMGQALTHRPFADALQDGSLVLGPMNRQELQAAVEKPAEMQGAAFETGLVQRILDDVGQEPGNLPLLEFALTLLWERMESGWMTHAAYEDIGRVDGALARYAEDVFNELDQPAKKNARRLFIQLVQPGEGTEDTRRVTRRLELAEELWSLVQYLADRRLVVTGRDDAGEETVEVVHEALIRGWERLQEWMHADRAFRTWQEGLRAAQRGWEASGQDSGALLRGAPLVIALEWLEGHQNQLSPAELTYIEASQQEALLRKEKEEARRIQELEIARKLAETEHARAEEEQRRAEEQAEAAGRLRRRAALLAGALVVAAMLAVVAVFFANQANRNEKVAVAQANQRATAQAQAEVERGRAEEQRAVALIESEQRATAQVQAEEETNLRATAESVAISERENAEEQAALAISRELAAASLSNLDADPELSILLAMKAMSVKNTVDAEEALHRSVQGSRVRQVLDPGGEVPTTWLTMSPDGEHLYTSGQGGGAVWDLSTGEILYATPQQTYSDYLPNDPSEFWINRADFSPDGSLLALPLEAWIGDEPATGLIAILDAKTGQEVLVFQALENASLHDLTFNHDGSQLAGTSVTTGQIVIWDVPATLAAGTGQQIASFCCQGELVLSVNYNPDDSLIVTTGDDGTTRIWDVGTGDESLTIADYVASDAVFTQDGQYVILADYNEIVVIEAKSGEVRDTIPGPRQTIAEMLFSPEGERLAASSYDGLIRIWNYAGGELHQDPLILSGHNGQVVGVAFTPDGRYLASGGVDGTARVWDVTVNGNSEFGAYAHDEMAVDVAFSPDSSWFVSTSKDGTARVWNVTAREELNVLINHEYGFGDAAINPDGLTLATAGDDGIVRIWDARTGMEQLAIQAHEVHPGQLFPGAKGVSYSPDGNRLATCGADEFARVWDTSTGEELLALSHTDRVLTVAYSPDGRWLLTTDAAPTIRLWDPVNGYELGTLSGDGSRVLDAQFSPDSLRLVTGHDSGKAIVWSFPGPEASLDAMPEKLYEIQHNPGWVGKSAFSPDGNLLAVGGISQSSLYDAATGERLLDFGPIGMMTEFSPNGHYIAAAGFDGIVRLLAANNADLMELARSRVTRSLNDEECQQYLHLDACPDS